MHPSIQAWILHGSKSWYLLLCCGERSSPCPAQVTSCYPGERFYQACFPLGPSPRNCHTPQKLLLPWLLLIWTGGFSRATEWDAVAQNIASPPTAYELMPITAPTQLAQVSPSFIQQILINDLLCVKHCSGHWGTALEAGNTPEKLTKQT